MKKLLWLDDERNPYINEEQRVPLTDDGQEFMIHWVLNHDEFVKYISKHGLPDAISFDHDLAPEHYTPEYFWADYDASQKYQTWKKASYIEPTGETCAEFLVNYCKQKKQPLPQVFVHSANPVGVDWIKSKLVLN